MPSFDLFEFYRFLLFVLAASYSLVRVVFFIWWWQVSADSVLGGAMVRRYLSVLLLRVRFWRFLYEFVVMAGLASILLVLIQLHWS